MTEERTKRLAELVLDLEGLKSERKALMRDCNDRIAELAERIDKLARDIRSGQLQLDDGPELAVVGTRGRA